MNIFGYKQLTVWHLAMDVVVETYRLTRLFPRSELYVITSQMRRAAISIPSNIAEGKRRKSDREFYRFINIAYASGAELETQIEIALRLKYLEKNEYNKIVSLLNELMPKLNKLSNKPQATS